MVHTSLLIVSSLDCFPPWSQQLHQNRTLPLGHIWPSFCIFFLQSRFHFTSQACHFHLGETQGTHHFSQLQSSVQCGISCGIHQTIQLDHLAIFPSLKNCSIQEFCLFRPETFRNPDDQISQVVELPNQLKASCVINDACKQGLVLMQHCWCSVVLFLRIYFCVYISAKGLNVEGVANKIK